jgi:hypothetical protein
VVAAMHEAGTAPSSRCRNSAARQNGLHLRASPTPPPQGFEKREGAPRPMPRPVRSATRARTRNWRSRREQVRTRRVREARPGAAANAAPRPERHAREDKKLAEQMGAGSNPKGSRSPTGRRGQCRAPSGAPRARGQETGGVGGIRTLGTGYPVRQFSKLLVSATHPRLRAPADGGL